MPKAYSYIRFSRPEQLRGDTLVLRKQKKDAEAQLAALRRFGARHASEPSPEQRRALMADLRARLASATPEERADLRTRLAQEVRGAFDRITFDPHRIVVTFNAPVPYGQGLMTRTVSATVFSDHPEEMAMLALYELDEDRPRDKPVSGLGRGQSKLSAAFPEPVPPRDLYEELRTDGPRPV